MSWPLRRIFRVFWWILCTATLLALPLTIWEFKNQGFSPHYQGWFIAGIFVIMTVPITVYEVAMHTEYYTRPRLQRHVIRILWMVPIYSIDSWFALRFNDARGYLDPIRECYEAYVIYNFYAYLMNYLEDELGDVEGYLSKKPPLQHVWPLNHCARPWRMGQQFIWETKKGVTSYVIVRPLCSLLALLTSTVHKYGDGSLDPRMAYPYLAMATNLSQMWALYCLVMFYQAFKNELYPIRPLSKFLCIKAVVFLTFWQGLSLNILVAVGAIKVNEQFTTYTATDVAEGLQNFLICIEMFIAALAHSYAFPPRDYMDPNIPTKGFLTNVQYMFDLRDVVIDVQGVLEDHLSTTTEQGRKALQKTAQGIVQTPAQIFGLLAPSGVKRGKAKETEDDAEFQAALLGDDELSSSPFTSHRPSDASADPSQQQQQQQQQQASRHHGPSSSSSSPVPPPAGEIHPSGGGGGSSSSRRHRG